MKLISRDEIHSCIRYSDWIFGKIWNTGSKKLSDFYIRVASILPPTPPPPHIFYSRWKRTFIIKIVCNSADYIRFSSFVDTSRFFIMLSLFFFHAHVVSRYRKIARFSFFEFLLFFFFIHMRFLEFRNI